MYLRRRFAVLSGITITAVLLIASACIQNTFADGPSPILLTSKPHTATIEGRVLDQTGNGILGANVLAPHAKIGVSSNTTAGGFRLINLPAGPETLKVWALGYSTEWIPVQLSSDSTLTLEVKLAEEPIPEDPARGLLTHPESKRQ